MRFGEIRGDHLVAILPGALVFAVGFAFAQAAGFGYSLEGVFFGETFADQDGDFAGEGDCAGCGGGFDVAIEDEDDFAADGGPGLQRGQDFGGGAAEELFVELGELAGQGDAVVGAEDGDDIFERGEDTVRGFVEDVVVGGG
jgi:hypothetical protein